MKKLKQFIKKYFSSFAFYYEYLGKRIFIAFILSVLVSFLDGLGLTMFFPLLQVVDGNSPVDGTDLGNLKVLIDLIEATGINLTLATVLIFMVFFFTLKGIATYLSSVYLVILQQSFIRKLRLNLLRHLNEMSYKEFVSSDVGRIQNTLSGEVDRVARSFNSYFTAFQRGVMVLVYLGFAFVVNPQFAILVSLGGASTIFLYRIIYKRTRGESRKLTTYSSDFQGQIIQHVSNYKYLKATGRVKKYGAKLRETIFNVEAARRRIEVLGSIAGAAREPILVVVISLVIFIQVSYFGSSIGAIVISLLFFYRALAALISLQNSWNTFMSVSGSLENMKTFRDELIRGKEKDGKVEIEQFNESIQMKDISFFYGETQILNDINLTINKNESVAFVGESGSGKTTLVNLATGLLAESKGEMLVDGIPLKDLNKHTFQDRIGYVSQDSVIFNDTLFNNITFWDEPTVENIERFEKAIQQASLGSFLNELKQGKETALGSNGVNLSGGQKQRVSIARELYKDIDILILDEATSALDSETEKAIQKSIDALQGKYTILIIAHRLSTIKNIDKIVFLDKGEILDIDNFEGLIKKQERFKKMVELQEL